ncbi:MAG: hypothetical protein MJB14_11120 [Spirochaetes bacterium]|nr:hypothetical protein [Spirochaetota bacterium]
MEDRSIIKPILDALEKLTTNETELEYFYHIIDKFCVKWFGTPVLAAQFDMVDVTLLHEILGEFIRFDSNNKRLALWLLSINRVCNNYTKDLSEVKEEINHIKEYEEYNSDDTLVHPILEIIIELEQNHLAANDHDKSVQDEIGNFLQWVGLYTTTIYPSLANKLDLYERKIIKAMNYLLMEFINLKSNDRRLAYLIMAIMEACKQFSFHNIELEQKNLKGYEQSIVVTAGQDEDLVEQILEKLKSENVKHGEESNTKNISLTDDYLKNDFIQFINDLNQNAEEAVTLFNQYIQKLTHQFLKLNEGNQFIFLETFLLFAKEPHAAISPEVRSNLEKSVDMLSLQTRNWLFMEATRLKKEREHSFEGIIQKTKITGSQNNSIIKLYLMLLMLKIFNLEINKD